MCKGIPSEFREYMDYVKALKFDWDPDYEKVLDYFRRCMKANQFQPDDFTYTWKLNRLKTDKEALKESLKALIDMKPKNKKDNIDVRTTINTIAASF